MAVPKILFRLCNLVGFLLVILINALGFFLPLGSFPNSSSALGMDFDAFGYIIWGLIYGLMLLFVLFQLLPFTYGYDFINIGITPFFIFHCLANIGWVLARAYAPDNAQWLQLVFIYGILLMLILTYSVVSKYVYSDIKRKIQSDTHFYINFIFGRAWLPIYLAWTLCLACVYSFSILTELNLTSYQNAAYTFSAIGLLSLILLFINRDILFGLTVVWSAIWLVIANANGRNHVNYDIQYPLFICAITVACVVGVACLITAIRNVFWAMARIANKRDQASNDTSETMSQV